MKVACLLFLVLVLTMSCVAFMQAASYAAPYQQTPAESSANENSGNPDGAHPREGHPQDTEHAVPAKNENLQKEGIPSEKRDSRSTPNKTHPRSGAHITPAHRPKQPPISQKRPPGSTTNLHQPVSDKSGRSAKEGLIQNKAQHIRSTSLVRPDVASLNPLLNNVRHRGPNPAVVGGSASSVSSNTGINGTRMNRKP